MSTRSTQSQPAPDAVPPQAGRRRRRLFLVTLLGILLGIGAGFAYFYHHAAETLRAALPTWPPTDEQELDPLVAKAIDVERENVKSHPFTAATWGRLGMIYFAHSYEAEAASCFVQAEKLDPKEARWHYLHGVLLTRTDMEAALREIERAADLCDA